MPERGEGRNRNRRPREVTATRPAKRWPLREISSILSPRMAFWELEQKRARMEEDYEAEQAGTLNLARYGLGLNKGGLLPSSWQDDVKAGKAPAELLLAAMAIGSLSGVREIALLGLWACGAPLTTLSSDTIERRLRAPLPIVEGAQMKVFPLAVSLTVQAMLLNARWAGRRRQLCLEQAAGVADHNRLAELEARVLFLEDALALRDAHVEVLERRLGRSGVRRPYEPTLRLRILWLAECFQVPRRRIRESLGVSRSSVHRWLKSLRRGLFGRCCRRREPANRTPEEIASLVWEVFSQNPMWGRHRTAMALWAMGIFVSPAAVRDILLRARPKQPAPAVQATKRRRRSPVRITAKCPNHTWSLDKTRVYRWGIWPTWVLVAVDHFSRKSVSVSPLHGSDADCVIGAMAKALNQHSPPAEIISDRDPVFTCQAFRDLLRRWGIRQRFGRLGQPGSIAVTERAILTLKKEWLSRVPILRGIDHLEQLLSDFAVYYNEYRGHMTLKGAVPDAVHTGQHWQRPERSAKVLPARMERRHFSEVRLTAFRLAA